MASVYDGSSLTVQPGPYYTITRDGTIAAAPAADPAAAFATDGEAAYYVKQPDGTYVQAVTRPVDSVDPSGRGITHYDPSKQLFFNVDNKGKTAYESRALTNNEAAPTGGGLLHHNPVWNPTTGQYDEGGLDWGNIASLGIAGALTGGVVNAALSGAPAAAGGPVLEGTAAGPGATTLAAGGVAPGTVVPEAGTLAATSTVPATGALAPGAVAPLTSASTVPAYTGTVVGNGASSLGATGLGATTAGTSLWSRLATSAIPVAGQLIGSAIQASASNNATDAQAAAAAASLAFLKDTLAKKQAALSPYAALGGIALQHLGLPPSTAPPTASVAAPAAGTSTQVQIPGYPNSAGTQGASPAPSVAPQTGPVQSQAQAQQAQPQSIQQLGQQQTQSSLGPAKSGDQRLINGQLARFDGTGWVAQQGAAA